MRRLSTVDVSACSVAAVLLLLTAVCCGPSAVDSRTVEVAESPEIYRPFAAARFRRNAQYDELLKADKRVGKLASWGRRDEAQDELGAADDREKRIGRLASWGKKSLGDNNNQWLDEATNKAIRSKWSSGSMSVWGKRSRDELEDEKRNKWNGNNMAVWGKRDDEKRGWENKNMALWG